VKSPCVNIFIIKKYEKELEGSLAINDQTLFGRKLKRTHTASKLLKDKGKRKRCV
jgi:hypothetical protein